MGPADSAGGDSGNNSPTTLSPVVAAASGLVLPHRRAPLLGKQAQVFKRVFPEHPRLWKKSIDDLAHAIGLHRQTVFHIMRGKPASPKVLLDIADALGLSPRDVLRALDRLREVDRTWIEVRRYRDAARAKKVRVDKRRGLARLWEAGEEE